MRPQSAPKENAPSLVKSGKEGQRQEPVHDDAEAFLSEQIITYIGNKRALLKFIGQGLAKVRQALGKERLDCADIFSGSGIVARYLKPSCRSLTVCDLEDYSAVVNSCYLSNRSELDLGALKELITTLNETAENRLAPGFISELYAPEEDANIQPGERVFYTRRNAMMIDTVRTLIDEIAPPELRNHVLAPLIYVASVHANTSGVFKGFYKNSHTGCGQFGGNGRDALSRICRPFRIPLPVLSEHECDYRIYQGDSNALPELLPSLDLAYLDPPYNQHPYGSNYFMLNLIARNSRPTSLSQVSGIPTDWNRSAYNKRQHARAALEELVRAIDAKFLLISFNSEGFIPKDEMLKMLGAVGETEILETSYNTFRGSRNLRNRSKHIKEYLFLVKKRGR